MRQSARGEKTEGGPNGAVRVVANAVTSGTCGWEAVSGGFLPVAGPNWGRTEVDGRADRHPTRVGSLPPAQAPACVEKVQFEPGPQYFQVLGIPNLSHPLMPRRLSDDDGDGDDGGDDDDDDDEVEFERLLLENLRLREQLAGLQGVLGAAEGWEEDEEDEDEDEDEDDEDDAEKEELEQRVCAPQKAITTGGGGGGRSVPPPPPKRIHMQTMDQKADRYAVSSRSDRAFLTHQSVAETLQTALSGYDCI